MKNENLFDVSKTEMVECDTLSSSLKELNINTLDYLSHASMLYLSGGPPPAVSPPRPV